MATAARKQPKICTECSFASVRAGTDARLVHPIEAVEDPRQVLAGDAGAGVLNRDEDRVLSPES